MGVIELATEKDRSQILELYKAQKGREYCAWDEDYPSDETISFDLSRDALFVMKENGKVIAAISLEEDEDVDKLDCWNRDLFPDPEGTLKDLHDMGYKTSLNLHPASGIRPLEDCYQRFVEDYLSRTDDYDGPKDYVYDGQWQFKGVEDWGIGDVCSCIMSDNGTELIDDDKIVKVKYDGWFSGWK